MKVLYIANHGQENSNDDEGSIAHSLKELGHEVRLVHEREGYVASGMKADFMLFHKWPKVETMSEIRMPRFLWYFDLVDSKDTTLYLRDKTRMDYINSVRAYLSGAFCSDGDWVERCTLNQSPEKFAVLRQGVDTRIKTIEPKANSDSYTILFTGTQRGGSTRESFVKDMTDTYGRQFIHVPRACHQLSLQYAVQQAGIVVAPDGPVTDKYWSNRVYLTLGFGGFLLHPRCKELEKEYKDNNHLVFYDHRADLHRKIQHYLKNPTERHAIAKAGMKHTLKHYSYLERCKRFIELVKERM